MSNDKSIQIVNEDGVLRGKDPETGESSPVNFESLGADEVNNVRWVEPSDGYDALQAELDALGSTPGTVVIGPGTIDDVDSNVAVPANTWLQGAGMYSTSLKFADGADLENAGLVRATGDNIVVSDLGVDGNRAQVSDNGQEYGVFATGTRNLSFARLYVHNCPGYGFDPHSEDGRTTKNLLISNCVAENNGLDGVTLAGIDRATVTGTVSYGNDRHGFNSTDVEGEQVGFIGCHADSNGGAGLAVQNSTVETQIVGGSYTGNATGMRFGSSGGEVEFSTIQSCIIARNNGYGVNVRGSSSISLSGVTFRDNARSSGNADITFQLTQGGSVSPGYNTIMGCVFEGVNQTYGVDERSGAGPTNVVGCSFRGSYSTEVSLNHADSNNTANLM